MMMKTGFDAQPHKLFNHKAPKTGVIQVKNFNLSIWKREGDKLMWQATYEKFRQNPALQTQLLNTGERIIVEATDDPEWGCGLTMDSPDLGDPRKWMGKNKMAFLLDRIKKRIKHEIKSK